MQMNPSLSDLSTWMAGGMGMLGNTSIGLQHECREDLEILALQKGIQLIQRIDDNYRNFPPEAYESCQQASVGSNSST